MGMINYYGDHPIRCYTCISIYPKVRPKGYFSLVQLVVCLVVYLSKPQPSPNSLFIVCDALHFALRKPCLLRYTGSSWWQHYLGSFPFHPGSTFHPGSRGNARNLLTAKLPARIFQVDLIETFIWTTHCDLTWTPLKPSPCTSSDLILVCSILR